MTPTVYCTTCGSALASDTFGWIEHHDDGSHTWHPADERPTEGQRPGVDEVRSAGWWSA